MKGLRKPRLTDAVLRGLEGMDALSHADIEADEDFFEFDAKGKRDWESAREWLRRMGGYKFAKAEARKAAHPSLGIKQRHNFASTPVKPERVNRQNEAWTQCDVPTNLGPCVQQMGHGGAHRWQDAP